MNERGQGDGSDLPDEGQAAGDHREDERSQNDHCEEHRRVDDRTHEDQSEDDRTAYQQIIPRLLRTMAIASVLFLGPVFWYYRWTGAAGFAFGAVVSYVNFLSLSRGIEGLADRIVNRNSREKGGRVILRFLVRYGLVAAVAYAIFKGPSQAFYGFLWGLCVPVAALMAEAVWEGYCAFHRQH
jgi:hypothetical protein